MADMARAAQHPKSASGSTDNRNANSPAAGAFNVLKACTRPSSDRESSLIEHRTLPRSRRRRTSPEDQAVLEAAFLQTPKPDKATRAEIVSRVTLGEKEVQIWFQNRRQIARRKAIAPTTQDESSTLTSSPTVTLTNESQPSFTSPTDQPANGDKDKGSASQIIFTKHAGGNTKIVSSIRGRDIFEKDMPTLQGRMEDDLMTIKSTNQSRNSDSVSISTVLSSETTTQNSVSGNEEPTATQAMSAAFIRETSPLIRPRAAAGLPPLLVKRQSSSLRLSTSSDGKARIVVDNGSSPPRPIHNAVPKLARPQQPLQRSQSEFSSLRPSTFSFGDSMPVPRRLAPSRSRDAKAWDFFCDDDARNALTVQADDEQKGKAETTIGLIRSTSSSKQLGLPSAPTSNHVKRKGSGSKSHSRPKLPRTESSLARLQSRSSNAKARLGYPDDASKKESSRPLLAVELSGDQSDKENWVPGTRKRHVRSPRPESEMRNRSTLRENHEIPSYSNSLESHLQREVGRQGRRTDLPTGKEDDESQDPEVAAFMGEGPVTRVAEDLDCVQQLLSLSQGAWS